MSGPEMSTAPESAHTLIPPASSSSRGDATDRSSSYGVPWPLKSKSKVAQRPSSGQRSKRRRKKRSAGTAVGFDRHIVSACASSSRARSVASARVAPQPSPVAGIRRPRPYATASTVGVRTGPPSGSTSVSSPAAGRLGPARERCRKTPWFSSSVSSSSAPCRAASGVGATAQPTVLDSRASGAVSTAARNSSPAVHGEDQYRGTRRGPPPVSGRYTRLAQPSGTVRTPDAGKGGTAPEPREVVGGRTTEAKGVHATSRSTASDRAFSRATASVAAVPYPSARALPSAGRTVHRTVTVRSDGYER